MNDIVIALHKNNEGIIDIMVVLILIQFFNLKGGRHGTKIFLLIHKYVQ